MFDFGMRLKELRLSRNLSQEALGKKLNRSKSVISGYECNIKIPPLEVLIDIANIFNVSLDYLVGIDKAEMISVGDLSESEKHILQLLLAEFKIPKRKIQGLTPNQQDFVKELMVEFMKKNS